jgi:flagellin
MSLSINTNNSAMVALETLDATQTELSATENAVSTGKSVANASDNPAAFGIAQQMTGNVAGQTAVNSGLTFAAQVVSSTNSAANQIITLLTSVQQAITSLGGEEGSPTSLNQTGQEITGYLAQIDTIAQDATYNGVNLLSGGTGDGLNISASNFTYVTGLQGSTQTVSGFNSVISTDMAGGTIKGTTGETLTAALGLSLGATSGAVATANVFVSVTSSGVGTLGTSFAAGGTATASSLSLMITQVQDAITAMTNVTSQLGAATNTIANMTTYGTSVSDDLTSGVGALTDANMAAESAQLTSLQTKQSLAIKSLTIANGQSQNILSLFQ